MVAALGVLCRFERATKTAEQRPRKRSGGEKGKEGRDETGKLHDTCAHMREVGESTCEREGVRGRASGRERRRSENGKEA